MAVASTVWQGHRQQMDCFKAKESPDQKVLFLGPNIKTNNCEVMSLIW